MQFIGFHRLVQVDEGHKRVHALQYSTSPICSIQQNNRTPSHLQFRIRNSNITFKFVHTTQLQLVLRINHYRKATAHMALSKEEKRRIMVEVSNAYNKISHAGLTAGKWLQAVRDIHPFFQNYKASDVANQLASLRRTLEKRKQKVGMMNSEETKLHSPKKQRVSGATAANNDPEQQNPLEFFLYRVLKFAENPISDDGNRVFDATTRG